MNFSPNQLKKELTMLKSSHRRRNRTIAMFLFKLFLLILKIEAFEKLGVRFILNLLFLFLI